MVNINSDTDLRNAILELERKQTDEGKLLKEQFHMAYSSMQPINILKNTLKQAVRSEDIKDKIVNTSVGLTAGFVLKQLFKGVTRTPVGRIFGNLLMFGVTNMVAKNPDVIKSVGSKLLSKIRYKPHENLNGKGHHLSD